MVSSIRVAHLLAHCVLIGSLAKLLFSFCMWSVLAFLQMVDAITGKVMSSMDIVLALKVGMATIKSPKIIYPRSRIILVEVQGIHVDKMDPKYF
jgi:hypothetical protein